MLSFKQYLNEYLTQKQIQTFSKYKMSVSARKATDHLFGKNNDAITGSLAPIEKDQSEVHKAVNRAVQHKIGRDITHQEYKSGKAIGLDGREYRLGGLLPNELKDHFANDPFRKNKDYAKGNTWSLHRGLHVFGQSNQETDKDNPEGHSWDSCKNPNDGMFKHYLPNEVKHGSLVLFQHDISGKEIGRATLHPYKNMHGETAYGVDSHYGEKSEEFKEKAKELAKQASQKIDNDIGEPESHIFKIHPDVYNDSGISHIVNPNASKEIVNLLRKHPDRRVRIAALHHDLTTSDHLVDALKDKHSEVRAAAAAHPLLPANELTKIIEGKDTDLAIAALNNPNHTGDHLMTALTSGNHRLAKAAMMSRKIRNRHIKHAIATDDPDLHGLALRNSNVSERELMRGAYHPDPLFARNVLHNKSTPGHILDKFFERDQNNADNISNVPFILNHPNATEDHFMKVASGPSKANREMVIDHKKVTSKVLNWIVNNEKNAELKKKAQKRLKEFQ